MIREGKKKLWCEFFLGDVAALKVTNQRMRKSYSLVFVPFIVMILIMTEEIRYDICYNLFLCNLL
jgi:hypothetical protein